MSFWFVRHGESRANARGVFSGRRLDSPLTPLGRDQASAVARRLPRDLSWILSSPLLRARETAVLIADAVAPGLRIEYDVDLAEWDVGRLTGTPIRDIDPVHAARHLEAEDPHDFAERVLRAVARHDGRDGLGLIVAHSSVVRVLLSVDGGEVGRWWNRDDIANAEIQYFESPSRVRRDLAGERPYDASRGGGDAGRPKK